MKIRARWYALSVVVSATLIATAIVWAGLRVDSASRLRDSKFTRLVQRINREGAERRDQTCKVFETAHLKDVKQLRQTYKYIEQLSPEERKTTLNRFVIQGLPQLEGDAHIDGAPEFCDRPGVHAERLYKRTHGRRGSPPIGLPEPDPVVPRRPPNLLK